jgi:hypothetical protein
MPATARTSNVCGSPRSSTSSIGHATSGAAAEKPAVSVNVVPAPSARKSNAKGASSGFFANVTMAVEHAEAIVFCTSAFAASSESVRSRRAPTTFGVTSFEGQKRPPTAPDSSRIGL